MATFLINPILLIILPQNGGGTDIEEVRIPSQYPAGGGTDISPAFWPHTHMHRAVGQTTLLWADPNLIN